MVKEVSNYALINDVTEIYPGMMMAAPPVGMVVPGWLLGTPGGRTADCLGRQGARGADAPISTPPKKPRTTRKSSGSRIHHVATKKVLDKSRGGVPVGKKTAKRHKVKS